MLSQHVIPWFSVCKDIDSYSPKLHDIRTGEKNELNPHKTFFFSDWQIIHL